MSASLELWAVALDVSGHLAVVTRCRLVTRVGMRGTSGDVVAALGASVLADTAAAFAGLVWGSDSPALGGGHSSLDVAEADCAEGMDTVPCPQDAGCG